MKTVQEIGRNWRDIVNNNFPNRTPLSAKNRYGLLQRRQGNKIECSTSTDYGPLLNSTQHGPSAAISQSSLPTGPSPGSDMTVISAVHSGMQLSPVHNPFPIDVSRNVTPVSINSQEINSSSAVLGGSTFWPIDVTGSNELPRRYLDVPRSDTIMAENRLGHALSGAESQTNKVLHVTVSCSADRLEEVMHNISKNMSELMVTGGVQRVQYSVE